MSEVETLLRVDAGQVPEGAVAFFARDPEATSRRLRALGAIILALAAGACAYLGGGRELAALLVLSAGMLGVSASPTEREPDEINHKRPTLVVTPTGIIVRDSSGLRTWRFEELAAVRPCVFDHRLGLMMVGRDGSRDYVDVFLFERGDRLGELIGRRVRAQTG